MGQAVKAVVGIVATVVGFATGQVWLSKLGVSLIIGGALDIVAQALADKPATTRVGQDIEYTGTVERRRIIYGRTRVSGMNVIPPWTSGDGNKFLHQGLVLAGHQVDVINPTYFNEVEILQTELSGLSGTVNDGRVQTGDYADRAWVRRYRGTSTQTHDFILNNTFGSSWTTAHDGKDVAWVAIQYQYDEKVYDTGKPEITFTVRGKICYDPRLDPEPGVNVDDVAYRAWTDNPALCLVDYMLDEYLGVGEDPERIDWFLVIAAANVCDEEVTLPDSETQARYTCNVVLEAAVTDDERRENISILAGAMMGHIVFRGGVWRIYAGCAASPTFELTEADFVGRYSIQTEMPGNEVYNIVRGQFVDADRHYQLVEFEPQSIASYITTDGDELPREVTFPACDNQYEAQRNARIVLKRSRLKKRLTATFGMSVYRIRPWDVGYVTFAALGWDQFKVRCTSWSFNPQGLIEATFMEEDDAVWDDPATGDYQVPTVGGGPTATPYTPSDPQNFTATPVVDGILFQWGWPEIVVLPMQFRLYEATGASDTFADAVIIKDRIFADSFVLPRADLTEKYYWLTAANLNPTHQSDPIPPAASTGVPGKALSITTGFRATVDNASHSKVLIGTGSGTSTKTSTVTPINPPSPPVTYSWARTAGSTKITAIAPSSQVTGFQATGLTDGEAVNATFVCTVTDSPDTATVTVKVSFRRDDSHGA